MKFSKTLFCFLATSVALITANAGEHAGHLAQLSQLQERYQPLAWLGEGVPKESEVPVIGLLLEESVRPAGMNKLGEWLEANPSSPWNASMQGYYAALCQRKGLYSRALEHFESAWDKTKSFSSGDGKIVGDFILARWTQLLASLGRAEKLQEVFKEVEGRSLEGPGAEYHFNNSKEGLYTMLKYPEVSYRCGTFALFNLAKKLGHRNPSHLLDVPSPTRGFSMTALLNLAASNQLGLAAVKRPSGAPLIIPCLVHWKQNHFAAILGRQGDLYWVADPTFTRADWMHLSAIDEEASGNFLIIAKEKPKDWKLLATAETDQIFGRGQPNNVNDHEDEGCDQSPGGKGAPCKEGCPKCEGMATWWVTEPYINLFIADEPLVYTTTHGEQMRFRWTYKQRDFYPLDSMYWPTQPAAASRSKGMTNASFSHNWNSSIRFRDTAWDALPGTCNPPQQPSYAAYEAIVYLTTGGMRYHYTNGVDEGALAEKRSKVRLEPMSATGRPTWATPTTDANGIAWGGNSTHGFRLIYPDGSQDIYNITYKGPSPCASQSAAEAFLSKRIDRFGRTNLLGYDSVFGVLRARYLVDYDGRTNTFRYSATFPELVEEIEDPWGRVASFQYHSSGRLTNITDAVGLKSSFQYQGTNGWITGLATPYGPTGFAFYEAPSTEVGYPQDQGNLGGHDRINRTIEITDPLGAKQLYMYRYELALMPDSYLSGEVPVGLSGIDNGGPPGLSSVSFRNSFYWGRKQYAALSTSTHANFTAADYEKGRMRHWLDSLGINTVSDRISIQREPSPDSSGATGGHKTWYSYDGKGPAHRVGTESLLGLEARVLPNGETQYTEWLYTAQGYPSSVSSTYTGVNGSRAVRQSQFTYATNGIDLVRETGTDATGTSTITVGQWAYNSFRQVTRFTNAENEVVSLSYESPSRKLTNITWPSGLVTKLTYNPMTTPQTNLQELIKQNGGFLAELAHIGIATNKFMYANGLLLTNSDSRGLKTVYLWDNLQRLVSATFLADNTYISNRYDKLDLVATQDRLGKWTYFGYDNRRQLTAVTNAMTNVTRFAYCACGSLESITNALQEVTTFTYDNQLRRTSMIFPSNTGTVAYQYDALGRATNIVDNANNVFSLSYNHQGLPVTFTNSYGPVMSVVYDARDNPLRVTSAANVTITNLFDKIYRLVARSYPDGGTERYQYSTNGLITFTNQLGDVTRYTNDVAGRLIGLRDANQNVVRFAYSGMDDLVSLFDGNGRTNQWRYDVFGRMTNKVDAAFSNVLALAYDANDRVTNRWTPAKGASLFTWDANGNLAGIDYTGTPDVQFRYDGLDRLTNMVDGVGTTAFSYTPAGFLQSEDGPWPSDTVTHTFNSNLQRTGLSLLQPSGSPWTQTFAYDSARRLQTLTSLAGAFNYAYVGGSRLTKKLTLPNTSYITNVYDAVAQLTGTWLKKNNDATLNFHGYAYDQRGQRTNTVRTAGDFAEYRYDPAGQLKQVLGFESDGTTPRLHEKLGYAYDAANNLTHRTNNQLVATFTTDSRNRLSGGSRSGTATVRGTTTSSATSVTVNGSGASRYADNTFASAGHNLANGNNTFTAVAQDSLGRNDTNIVTAYLSASPVFAYDANGNLLSDGLQAHGYDGENQLTNILVTNVWQAVFRYDGLLRRRVRQDYAWQNGTWVLTNEVRYVYDGMLVLQERDRFNIPQITYTRGLDLSASFEGAGGIGGMLARTDSSLLNPQHSYYHADGNGNVTALADAQQKLVAQYIYEPFGNLVSMSGPLAAANTYRFSSKEVHPNSGYYYFGYRFYSPHLQRWLSEDPIGEEGDINLYRFVRNDSLNLTDAWGFDPKGHHYVCQAFWNKDHNRVSPELQDVFDSPEARVSDPLYDEHNRKSYGGVSESEYREATGKVVDDFVKESKKGSIGELSVPQAKQLVNRIKKMKRGPIGKYNRGVAEEKNRVAKGKQRLGKAAGKLKAAAAAGMGACAVSAVDAIASNPHYQDAVNAANQGDLEALDDAIYDLAADISVENGDAKVLPALYGPFWWLKTKHR